MVIDVHAHIFPDKLAERALALLAGRSGVHPFTDGTAAGLLASMRRSGIDRACLMPIATKPEQARGINRWVAALAEESPEFIPFGTVHPAQDDWRSEIEFIVNAGFPGVKLHPDYQEFFADDPSIVPLLHALRDAGLVVMVHAGVDIGLPPPVHCFPSALAKMLDSAPGLTVIAAHMGGWSCWDDVEKLLIGRDLYIDTSFSLSDMGPERMASMARAHGVERTLFGTDSPWADQSAEVAGVRALPFSPAETEAILSGNTRRLLNLP